TSADVSRSDKWNSMGRALRVRTRHRSSPQIPESHQLLCLTANFQGQLVGGVAPYAVHVDRGIEIADVFKRTVSNPERPSFDVICKFRTELLWPHNTCLPNEK